MAIKQKTYSDDLLFLIKKLRRLFIVLPNGAGWGFLGLLRPFFTKNTFFCVCLSACGSLSFCKLYVCLSRLRTYAFWGEREFCVFLFLWAQVSWYSDILIWPENSFFLSVGIWGAVFLRILMFYCLVSGGLRGSKPYSKDNGCGFLAFYSFAVL